MKNTQITPYRSSAMITTKDNKLNLSNKYQILIRMASVLSIPTSFALQIFILVSALKWDAISLFIPSFILLMIHFVYITALVIDSLMGTPSIDRIIINKKLSKKWARDVAKVFLFGFAPFVISLYALYKFSFLLKKVILNSRSVMFKLIQWIFTGNYGYIKIENSPLIKYLPKEIENEPGEVGQEIALERD